MICKSCGADIGNKGKCAYCDTVYFEEYQRKAPEPAAEESPQQKKIPKEKAGRLRAKLSVPAKVACLLWFVVCMGALPQIEAVGFAQYLLVAVIGFAFYGGIAQLISTWYVKRHPSAQIKKTKRKTKLTLPAKIACVVWFLCCLIIFTQEKTYNDLWTNICVAIFGFLFYGGITQLISSKLKKEPVSDPSGQTQTAAQPQTLNAGTNARSYDHMDVPEFILYCCDILEKSGFTELSVTRMPQNEGIDIIAYKGGIKYGILCKCGVSRIGISAVQKALDGKKFFDCHVSAVLSNQFFSEEARELADREDVLLWDRNRLNRFIDSHQ